MASLESKNISRVTEKLEKEVVKVLLSKEDKVDEELKKIEHLEEDELERLRRERLLALKKRSATVAKLHEIGHGVYNEVTEKDFFYAAKVAHFFRSSTFRCLILDKHIKLLASKYLSTRFIKVNAEKAPFLVEKLNIRVLPTTVLVKEGCTIASLIGFEAFGGTDDFTTANLEDALKNFNILDKSLDHCLMPSRQDDDADDHSSGP